MVSTGTQSDLGVTWRIAFPNELAQARMATRAARRFLEEQGMVEEELFAFELCLAEACNNAVQHAGSHHTHAPILIEAACTPSRLDLRVTDRTPGFDWPGRIEALPPDRETGRGLFIIQSLMDDVDYLRGRQGNTLLMRKARVHRRHLPAKDAPPIDLIETRRRLLESEATVGNMARELCFRSESLSAIFRCCAELGRTADSDGFAHRLLNDLLHLTSCDWFVVRLHQPDPPQLVVFTASDPELQSGPIHLPNGPDGSPLSEVTAALTRRRVRFDASRCRWSPDPLQLAGAASTGLVQPLLFGENLIGTLAVGKRASPLPFTGLHIEVIQTFAEFLAIQVVNARHREETLNSRLVARELEIASTIQRALLPRALPQFRGFSLAGYFNSARQVGGDFYDALPLDDHSILLVMADVMGKGVPAAIFATITRSLVRAISGQTRHPARLLARLNRLLYQELSSVSMFVTAQLVLLDFSKRRLVAAGAGHCPALLSPGNTGRIHTIRTTGTPLGVIPRPVYRQRTANIDTRVRLFLHTDGLTETRNNRGEMLGQDRLVNWLRSAFHDNQQAGPLRDQLAAELRRFMGDAPPRDDQAFLVLVEDEPAPEPVPEAAERAHPAAVSPGHPLHASLSTPLNDPTARGHRASQHALYTPAISS